MRRSWRGWDGLPADDPDHWGSVGAHGVLDPAMQRVIAVERHARKQVMNRMQVLAQPEPFERFQPSRHDQAVGVAIARRLRSEEHTSELQSLMRISYDVFCLKKKKK